MKKQFYSWIPVSNLFKPIQISEFEFKFFRHFRDNEEENWLNETSHKFSREDKNGQTFITFEDAQGAVEFKLRFIR